ncbi:MAG: class I SAM-dependent methyltransferase [Methanothrix sp.]|nr:class I SAM-dependent methyltransferase [Methanothrix sp.]
MPGIINWDLMWKVTHSNGLSHHGKDLVSHWDNRAQEFNRRVMKNSEWAERQVGFLGLCPHETVLDVGAGTGRLAIPISRLVRSVTALDQSSGMLSCLQENIRAEGIKNIRCIHKSWQDASPDEIGAHDVVLSSNSLGVYDLREALEKMDSLAKRAVYIFTFTDHRRDDGFEEFLRRGSYGNHLYRGPASYLIVYNLLADMGILADIKILEWQSEEQFGSLEEAVASWRKMHEAPAEREAEIKEFLSMRLVREGDKLCMRRHHSQAMISWQKGRAERA